MNHVKQAEWGFLLLVLLYILLCYGLAATTGHTEYVRPAMYLDTGLTLTVTLLGFYVLYRLFRALWILIRHRPKHPGAAIWEDLKAGPLRTEIYKRAIPVFIGFFFFFSTFTSMKILIPQIHPFAWDEFLIRADNLIHFGHDPWRLLHTLLGHPWITKIIGLAYIFWLASVFIVLYWQLFRLRDETLRMRFFYTFVLSWAINGTFLAIFFSSAGPCFVDEVLSSDYYAPLMEYLRTADTQLDIYAVYTQDLLWRNYADKDFMLGGGISAFPSVHVATAFLFVLVGKQAGKYWLWGFVAFFVLILLGSIHLGWHYAVDGYFSILTTLGLWWFSGKILRRIGSV